MKDGVGEEIFEIFPNYIRGVVVARNLNNKGVNERLESRLRDAEKELLNSGQLNDLAGNQKIASWRNAFKEFGAQPGSNYPAVESLARRVRSGKPIPYINTLVAIFNLFSISNLVPSGGDDLDAVKGDIWLRMSKGTEPFTPFNGDSVEFPYKGEIILADDEKVMCRRWCWRQADQTKLSPGTKSVAINIDCLPPISRDEAQKLTETLADIVDQFCGGEISYFLIDQSLNEVEIP